MWPPLTCWVQQSIGCTQGAVGGGPHGVRFHPLDVEVDEFYGAR